MNFSFSYNNHSRFDFVNNNNFEEGINVPEYIIDIIDQNLTLLVNSNDKSQKNNFDFNFNFNINSNWSDFINYKRIN